MSTKKRIQIKPLLRLTDEQSQAIQGGMNKTWVCSPEGGTTEGVDCRTLSVSTSDIPKMLIVVL